MLFRSGPSVRLRSKSSYGGAYQRADGVDHRSILCQLLQRTNQTKKRLREDLTAPIPPWSTLHNPVATKSLVIIEIQWDTSPESWIELTAKLPILNQLIAKKHNKYFAVPLSLTEGYLLIFDHSKRKIWKREWTEVEGKKIFMVWV